MPRVHQRKARKDYPDQGIAKGDTYFYTKIKTGPRSSKVMRSKTRFKASQLTTSPFKSAFYAIGESWNESAKDADAIREAAEAFGELAQEARESFDNMPEGLQQGDTGQLLEARADGCENAQGELETLADELDGLDRDDYAEDTDDFEDEKNRIVEEAENAIHEMPEG